MQPKPLAAAALLALAMIAPGAASGTDDDSRVVADLDTAYQAAVERNDWQAMDRILHPDFVLVIGNGTAISRAQLIDSARNPIAVYEKQVEMPGTQKVRLFGRDTAVVTALLWLKGTRDGGKTEFDYKFWFSEPTFEPLKAGSMHSGRRRCGCRRSEPHDNIDQRCLGGRWRAPTCHIHHLRSRASCPYDNIRPPRRTVQLAE